MNLRDLVNKAVDIVKTLWDDELSGPEKLERGTDLLLAEVEKRDDLLLASVLPAPWQFVASAAVDNPQVDSYERLACKLVVESAYQTVSFIKTQADRVERLLDG